MRERRTAVLFLVAILVAGSAQAQESPSESVAGAAVQDEQGDTAIEVSGSTVLPTGACIVGSLYFHGATVQQHYRAYVEDGGRFQLRFGPFPGKTLLEGLYVVRLEAPAQVQPPAVKGPLNLNTRVVHVQLGSREDGERALEMARRKLLDTAESYRLAYLELAQAGGYYMAELLELWLREKANPPPPPAFLDEIRAMRRTRVQDFLPAWKRETRASFEERLMTARFDFRSWKSEIVATPWLEAEAILDQLERAIELWNVSVQGELYKLCGEPVPESYRPKAGVFEPKYHVQAILDASRAFYEALGVREGPPFRLGDLGRKETGLLDPEGDWYLSFTTKFAVRKPHEWQFWKRPGTKPSLRMRLGPKGSEEWGAADVVVVGIEILDYPSARSHDHLASLAREAIRNRWTGGREASSRRIETFDPTMAGDKRPGLETEIVLKDKGKGGAPVELRLRYRQLFCRWHKRTYGVLCMSPSDRLEDAGPRFEKVLESFRVLDDPAFSEHLQPPAGQGGAKPKAELSERVKAWALGEGSRK